MKKIKMIVAGLAILVFLFSFESFRSRLTNPTAPTGYSGAPTQNRTCRNCHNDFALNTAGGSVIATGLPTGSYVPGQVYNFSVTISNAVTANIWGFEVKAVTSGGSTAIGTFSTTNPNVVVANSEIKHGNAVAFTGTSYTYTNLKWTAPAAGSPSVSFYFTGVAGDNDASELGDYVYSNSLLNVPIPVTLGDFAGTVNNGEANLEWTTWSEMNTARFEVERSTDGKLFEKAGTIAAAGISNSLKKYKFTDQGLPMNVKAVYYRLNMVDIDGTASYSKVIILKPGIGIYVNKCYPTMLKAGDKLNLEISSNTNQKLVIGVYAASGQRTGSVELVLNRGMNNIALDQFRNLTAGLYLVRFNAGDFSDTRMIKVE